MFAFKLALALGCTVAELSVRMTYREFIEWTIFYKKNPWGYEIEDVRNAMSCATTANSNLMVADPKKLRTSPFTASMFRTLKPEEEKPPVEDENASLSDRIKNKLFRIMNERKRK